MSITQFLQSNQFQNIPPSTQKWCKLSFLDLLATAACATATTPMSQIIRNHVATLFPATTKSAELLFDGRKTSPPAAAMSNACTIDAIDSHDGQKLTKGHAGCGTLPILLSLIQAENKNINGAEFLNLITMGYEISTRAGIALHRSVPDYHASGSWNCIGGAAIGAQLLELSETQILEVIGIAEYHGPRSQMMRCIDAPTMVKDSSAMGAFVGCQAVYLAADGFTGAPAITVVGRDVSDIWADLGKRWYMEEQYYKLYPVCRWAQPAIAACEKLICEKLMTGHKLPFADIENIKVTTFHEAVRLAVRAPATTEEAQYSLPFPVAAFLVRGCLTAVEVTGKSLGDEDILAIADKIEMVESDKYNEVFPAKRMADVEITLAGGEVLNSGTMEAAGDPETPLSEGELRDKFFALCGEFLGTERSQELWDLGMQLENEKNLDRVWQLITCKI